MSCTNLIKNTLDILDLNITFNENCLKKERLKGRICQVFSGTLDYSAHTCPHCELEDKDAIICWGFTSCLILLNNVSEYQTYLRLKKRRFSVTTAIDRSLLKPVLLKNIVPFQRK